MDDLLQDTPDAIEIRYRSRGSSSLSNSPRIVAPGQDTEPFFKEVNAVLSSMRGIRRRLYRLQNLNEDFRTVTRPTAVNDIKEKLDKNLAEISEITGELRERLETLNRSNVTNRRFMNCQEGSSTDLLRMSTVSNLRMKLRQITDDFQQLRQRFLGDHRELVQRRLSTATEHEVADSIIDRFLETEESEPIFEIFGIQPGGRGELLDAIGEIRERRDAVSDIERKLMGLHQDWQAILDMRTVVEPQDELPDNTDVQVGRPVEPQDAQPAQSQELKKASRNTTKMRFIVGAATILVFIALDVAVMRPLRKARQPQ